jgi:hypothetical protein
MQQEKFKDAKSGVVLPPPLRNISLFWSTIRRVIHLQSCSEESCSEAPASFQSLSNEEFAKSVAWNQEFAANLAV